MLVGRKLEEGVGSRSKSGDMGEKKKIWNRKARKQASRNPEHAGTQRFIVQSILGIVGEFENSRVMSGAEWSGAERSIIGDDIELNYYYVLNDKFEGKLHSNL